MFKWILVFISIFTFSLFSEEIQDPISSKKNKIFIKRNDNLFTAMEEEVHRSLFRSYYNNGDEKVVNYQIGFLYNFLESDFSIEGRFQELRKGNYSNAQNVCSVSSRSCLFITAPIGTYFRNEIVVNGMYDAYDQLIFVKVGTRFIRSELSDTNYVFSTDRFNQSSLGVNIGIKLLTPKFYNFYLSLDLETFYSQGTLKHEFSNTTPRGINIGTYSKGSPHQKTWGQEITAMLNYDINQKFYIGIGFSQLRSTIRPNEMIINTGNFNYDTRKNMELEILGGKSFSDSFFASTVEFGVYF
ncbi:hypothetical protein [Leptospira sp. GIMC2001]|uniref:hypothetical protein n=1 Tax=Leptospira sp. GIMC2001 TaxID=1513297 RepID=UPI002349AFC6|nr:hypothetical protein [Leptospira sp. GIMC2001]WCL49642.1 hypothetical protein O4O04_02150 [Leptospira sp. GIMC2001]